MTVSFVDVVAGGTAVRLEYRRINPDRSGAPLLVFLHEGLGSVAQWRHYPQHLCDALGCRGLVYSRAGYGRSTPRRHDEHWPVSYLEDHARDVLPAFLAAVGAGPGVEKPWLFGHSDGGSIALLYAALYPDAVAGIVVLAPHIFVEEQTVAGIAAAKTAYETTEFAAKLGRYHDDPDSAFWGWNRAWLDPDFRDWNIEALLPAIRCPVLAVQGYDDEYASMAQLDGIKQQVPQTRLLKLPDCGHTPHRDCEAAVTAAVVGFIQGP